MKKILIDTGVLMNLLEKKEPEYKSIARILSDRNKLKVKVFFTSSTIHKIINRLSEEKSANEVREIIRRICQLGKVIDAYDKVYRKALNAPLPDLETALQYYTAENHHMDFIISDHVPNKHYKKLQIINADQFLNLIK